MPDPFVPLQLPPDTGEGFQPLTLSDSEPEQPEAPSISFGDRARDMVDSVNSGIGTAFHETVAFGAKAVGTLAQGGERLTKPLVEAVTGTSYGTPLSDEALEKFDEFDRYTRAADGSDFQPRTIVGSVSKSGAQFVTAFIGAGHALRMSRKFSDLSAVPQAVVQGAVADAVGFDPHQERIGNLVKEFNEAHPSLQIPIASFLASDPNDSEAVGRIKSALEGMMAGAVVEKFLQALKATRNVIRAKPAEAPAIIEQASDDLAALHRLSDGLEKTDKLGRRSFYDAKEADRAAAVARGETYSPTVQSDLELLKRVGGLPKDPSVPTGGPKVPDVEAPWPAPKDPPPTPAPVRTAADPILSDDATASLLGRLRQDSNSPIGEGLDFNFSKMDGPDGAKQAIDELSALVRPEIEKAKGGVQSHALIEEMADTLGGSPDELMAALASQAKDAPEQAARLVAGKELLQSVGRRVSDLAKTINAGGATKEMQDEFVAMANRMTSLQVTLKAVQTGAARTTAAGRIRTRDSFSNADIRDLAATNGDLKQIAPMLRPVSMGRKLWNAYQFLRVNSLLSRPVTQARNIIGTSVHTMMLPVERMIGGLLSGQRDVAKEGAHIVMAFHGAIWDSLRMAGKAFRNSESVIQPYVTQIDVPRNPISAKAFDIQNPTLGALLDAFGNTVGIPTRLLLTGDEFLKQVNYRAQVRADVTQAGIRKGLEGSRLADFIEAETRKAFNAAGEGIDPKALEYASRATFTNAPLAGGWTENFESFARKVPLVRLAVPFVRTPSNILKGVWFRSPVLNLLSREFKQNLREGGTKRADAVGQMATGSLFWLGGFTLAAQGLISGTGPSDPRVRAQLMDTGWKPNAFKTSDGWVTFNGLDPVGMFLGMSADIYEATASADEKGLSDAAIAANIALAKQLSSKTYLQGLTQVLNAFSDPDNKGEAFLRQFVASHVPMGIKDVAGLIPGVADEEMREARTMLDAIRNKIPGLSKSLPPRRNIFGEPIPVSGAVGPDFLSPFQSSTMTNEPAKLELARLAHGFSKPALKVQGLDLTTYQNAKGQSAYDRWQESMSSATRGGRTLKEAITAMVTSGYYQAWKASEQSADNAGNEPRTLKEVRALVEEYRQTALQKTIREFPQLARDLQATKQAKIFTDAGVSAPDSLQELLKEVLNPK